MIYPTNAASSQASTGTGLEIGLARQHQPICTAETIADQPFWRFWRQIKNPAVATTTAKGAAVSSSRMTAVQSVYITAVA